jgi:hypothetical protein
MTSPVPPINPGNRDYRIGDAERQEAMDVLGKHFTAGRLDITEYDNRLASITNAVMQSDLAPIFADLPPLVSPSPTPPPSVGPAAATNALLYPPNAGYEPENHTKVLYRFLMLLPLFMLASAAFTPFLYMLSFMLLPLILVAVVIVGMRYLGQPTEPPQQVINPQQLTAQQYQQIQLTQQQVTVDPYNQQLHHNVTRWRYNSN